MGLKQKIRAIVLRSDIFACNASLRHRGQPSYQTICGGLFSMIIFVAFLVIFLNSLSTVITKVNIESTTEISDTIDSSHQIDDLFFAIGIEQIDMNAMNRYFSVIVSNKRHQNYSVNPISQRQVRLQACKREDWAAQSELFGNYFDIYGVDKMLCLAPNQSINIFGHEGSTVWEYLEFRIQQCVNNSYQNPCASTLAINSFITTYLSTNDYFKVRFFTENKIITPTNAQPIEKVLEKDFFLSFTTTLGSRGSIHLGTYELNTDDSILPFQSISTQKGHFYQQHQTHTIQLRSTHYISFQMTMSTTYRTIDRNHGKIDDMLSYIGGLFGLLITFAAFFIASYSQYCYQMSVADCAFEKDKEVSENRFNFFTYMLFSIYDYLVFFGIAPKSKRMEKILQAKDEACEQMDMRLIIKRMNYFENLSKVLLEEHQRMSLYMAKLPSLTEIAEMRERLEQFQELKVSEASSQVRQDRHSTEQKMVDKPQLRDEGHQMAIISGKFMKMRNQVAPQRQSPFQRSIQGLKSYMKKDQMNLSEYLQTVKAESYMDKVSAKIYQLTQKAQSKRQQP